MEQHKLFFIIGASGSGKTTIVKELEKNNFGNFQFRYFDSIGVPSFEDMVKEYGSGEAWQKAKTFGWSKKLKPELETSSVILDGQIRQSFVDEACKENDVSSYSIILFDCTNEERIKRLTKRGQPELANADMLNWAKYLREQSLDRGDTIIDTTGQSIEESRMVLERVLNKK